MPVDRLLSPVPATLAPHDASLPAVMRVVRDAPCFAAVRPILSRLVTDERWPTLDELSEVAGIRCVADVGTGPRRGLRPRAQLYDALIAERGVLPTRSDNWHDLFNVVSWAMFPESKRALHARQFRRLAERVPELYDKLPGARTEEQSALTRLDEGGMLVAFPDARDHDGLTDVLQALAVSRQPLEAQHLAPFRASCRVFGHALHEHLGLGGPLPRAALVLLAVPPSELDTALATLLWDDGRPFRCASASAWVTRSLDTTG